MTILTDVQRAAYERDGFIVVPDVFTAAEIDELRRVTDGFVARSATVAANDGIYDLEDTHSAAEPRVRRLKAPHLIDPVYFRASRNHKVVAILTELWGSVRFDTGKLNMKSAGYGAPVEWHQDWAFYPHTNDDLCAVGVMMDDCELENGPLLCIPGSHKGPVYDHHADSVFCGAIDPETVGLDFSSAVPCTGKPGSVSIHHARTIHGSALNTSDRMRRLFLLQYRAADAWPLLATHQPKNWEEWQSLLLCGESDPIVPRCTEVPVRIPLPAAQHQGSIYENQRGLKHSFFASVRGRGAVAM
jgi:phytanoyl-CoA hydroxylase